MGNSFRPQPLPAIYGENKTPFANDLVEVGILVAFAMIAFSFILIIPGIRGIERLWATVRVFVTLWIGASLLVCNFGYEWYGGKACVKTQYKGYVNPPNAEQEIEAEVGVHIGLRGLNITLREVAFESCAGTGDGAEYYEERPFPYETINYNEAFRWSNPWAQGRLGFGLFAGRVAREFRAGEFRGMPYPILWIAEYFTLDGEQIRWGRKFRQAGWYAHQLLWLSFALYLITILLFIFVIGTGGWFMLTMGLLMVLASFAYAIIILNDPHIFFPFADDHGEEVVIVPTYGWSWWLNLITGIATVILAVIVLFMNYFFPRQIAVIFHHSVVEEDEFFQVEEEEEIGGDKGGFEASRGGRGRTTRGRGQTQRRGISKYRQTQRKPRSTIRSSTRGGPRSGGEGQRLTDEIQLQEVSVSEK